VSTPETAPQSSTARGAATRERQSHALSAAALLTTAHTLPPEIRSDCAHLLRLDWHGVGYTRARDVLAGAILPDRDPPQVDPGSYRTAVAVRLAQCAQTLHTERLEQLEQLVYILRHAWIGGAAERPERVVLREAARLIQDRRRSIGGAS
jgi:hypothetical protein